MPDLVSDLTPEPYTSTSDAVLQIGSIFGLNMKFNTGAARVLADYLNGHDREVAARAQAEIAKALDRLRVPEYCVTGDQKEAYRWALNRAHATARDYDKAGESQND